MLVSHLHKFVFLRPHKVASTTIEGYFERFCLPVAKLKDYKLTHKRKQIITSAGVVTGRLQEPKMSLILTDTKIREATDNWLNHMLARTVKKKLGDKKWNSYYKFGAIRNPYTLLISWFFFASNLNYLNFSFDRINLKFERDYFNKWILTGNNCEYFFEQEYGYLKIDNKFCCDDFIRFENLNEDIKRISDHLNLPFDPEYIKNFKKRTGNNFTPTQLYTKKAKQKVIEVADDYLKLFNYSFPNEQNDAS
jgi:hypothetical protein